MAFAASNNLKLRQADIETAYLYGFIDVELYMRLPDGVCVEGEQKYKRPCVKVKKSLYGLKQAGRIWYLHLSKYLIQCGFKTNESCPCLFIKRYKAEIIIVGIYVDDIIMVGTDAALKDTMIALKNKFKVKDLGHLSYCLGLQIEVTTKGIKLHQGGYIKKILNRFNMGDVLRPNKTPMVVRSLTPSTDVYGPRRKHEIVLKDTECPYQEAIGALQYLANCSRPDIAFAVSVLSRYSKEPTKRHWTGIKQILRYLSGTVNYGLYYKKVFTNNLTTNGISGYADAGYLSDPHKARSQTGYTFMIAGAAIVWRSTKQTLVATSTNHSEIIALYEACRECVWLRRMITFVSKTLQLNEEISPIIIYEDNSACVLQVQKGYIKGDRTKHIDPKFFFMHELNGKELKVQAVSSTENVADLFTKSLGSVAHNRLCKKLGICT